MLHGSDFALRDQGRRMELRLGMHKIKGGAQGTKHTIVNTGGRIQAIWDTNMNLTVESKQTIIEKEKLGINVDPAFCGSFKKLRRHLTT